MDINSQIDNHFSTLETNGFTTALGTEGGGDDPGTGGTGWWDVVPWDTIGGNVDGLLTWLIGNNGANGAPYYNPQKDYTTVILAVGGGLMLMLFIMLLMLRTK